MSLEIEQFKAQVNDFKQERPRYKKYADVLEEVLRLAARQCCPLAFVQSRVKSVASYAEKIIRPGKHYDDPLKQITDLCGARVVTAIKGEAEAICRFVRAHFDIDEANSLDAMSRLHTAEFGYRSVHYIVQFRPGVFPKDGFRVTIPDDVHRLKAEIQVRTMPQHAWADIGHDRLYKSTFVAPQKFRRESARIAALMEKADDAFAELAQGIDMLRDSAGVYRESEEKRRELEGEIERREAVLEFDPCNLDLLAEIARLRIVLEQWDAVIALLPEELAECDARLLSHLGYATCCKSRAEEGTLCESGRELQQLAIEMAPHNVRCRTRLAASWLGVDDGEALRVYESAFRVAPTDPETLAGYLRLQIARAGDRAVLTHACSSIEAAIQKCRDQIEVKLNLPDALFLLGELQLLAGRRDESLDAFIRAVSISEAHDAVKAYGLVKSYEPARDHLPVYEAVMKFLLLARDVKSGGGPSDELQHLAMAPMPAPVAIVAGGCDPKQMTHLGEYRDLLTKGFFNYRGTIISGGTIQGISGLVGELTASAPDRICSIGHLPEGELPSDANKDDRYTETRECKGRGFSVLQPIQYWIDIVASGISPSEVTLIGINGGKLSAFEYRLAATLGASVAVLNSSGREADVIERAAKWGEISGITSFMRDPMTLNALLSHTDALTSIDELDRERIARQIHETYREMKGADVSSLHPSLAPWEELDDALKQSNLNQADHIPVKLARLGKTIRKVPADRAPEVIEFTPEEMEKMIPDCAEMEHGRWNAEKLRARWRYGKKRDDERKIHDCLRPWSELPEEIRKYDIETVEKIPTLLAESGYEIIDL